MKKARLPLLLLTAFLLGWIVTGGIRLALYKNPNAHFHANFRMELNGKAIDFSPAKYQEDVAACAVSGTPPTPRQRAHMHNGDGSAIHVHQAGVSWGQFFQSLGYNVGKNYIVDDGGTMYASTAESPLRFTLNGQTVPDITDRLIKSEDRLLITYGSLTPEQLKERLTAVPQNASALNSTADPATCSSGAVTLSEKLRQSFLW